MDVPKENAKPGNGEDWHVVDADGSDQGSEITQVTRAQTRFTRLCLWRSFLKALPSPPTSRQGRS